MAFPGEDAAVVFPIQDSAVPTIQSAKPKWKKVMESPLMWSVISSVAAIVGAVFQQFYQENHTVLFGRTVYWGSLIVLLCSVVSISSSLYQYWLRAKENKIEIRCPRFNDFWFLYYPPTPQQPVELQQGRRYYGTLLQIIGLTFGALQVLSASIGFRAMQRHGVENPVRFSFLPIAFCLIMVFRNLCHKEVEQLFCICINCRGERHYIRVRVSNHTITVEGIRHLHDPPPHRQQPEASTEPRQLEQREENAGGEFRSETTRNGSEPS